MTRATQVPAEPPRLSPTGLSPTLARLSSALRLDVRVPLVPVLQPHPPKGVVWAIPLSFATTKGIEVSFYSSRYLDVSVPWVPLLTPMYSAWDTRGSLWWVSPFGHPRVKACFQLTEAYRR